MSALRAAVTKGVHLRIFPRPANLTESREVLRVLQQFGEVSTFKHLKFEHNAPAPNVCIAIYQNADSAAKLLKASPLRFALEHVTPENHDDTETPAAVTKPSSSLAPGHVERSTAVSAESEDAEFQENDAPSKRGAEEMIRPSQLLFGTIESFGKPQEGSQREEAPTAEADYAATLESTTKESVQSDQLTTADAQIDTATPSFPQRRPRTVREFHLTADVLEMNHRDYIERTWWYWQFRPRSRSFAFQDLHTRGVPEGIADIHTEKPEQRRRIVKKFREELAARPTLREIGMQDTSELEVEEIKKQEQAARFRQQTEREPAR